MTTWWTFVLQVVNFLALVWLLHRFLYRPVQRTISERQHHAAEAAARVTVAEAAADAARTQMEHEREAVAAERAHVLDDVRAKAEAERTELIAKARAAADELAASQRQALDVEREKALASLQARAAELAASMAAGLLGELGSPTLDDELLERADAYLAELPPARLSALATEATGGVEVVTAHELPPQTIARRREKIAARLGDAVSVSFRADPSLVAGGELHFRTAIVRVSWRDALAHAVEQARAIAG
jgi:F-type H+-transporting ATPase subunit b